MIRKLSITKLFFVVFGAVIMFLYLYVRTQPQTQNPPDVAPFSSELREEDGAVVWPNRAIGVGLPLSHIQDLGDNRLNVLLVVIVSSAPVRRARRDAIRRTWWLHCQNNEVACHFFTDGLVVNKQIQQDLLEETSRNKDMEFQPLLGGIEFGLRFLYHIKWATAKYNFQYFLRTDDDYFVCLQKLLHELPVRPKKHLCWGYFHCGTWLDESWMVFSRDIIVRFLEQDARTMVCHPHADQQIALWLNNISERVFFHDDRVGYVVGLDWWFDWNAGNVCDKYMGVHQAYASRMLQLGKASADGPKQVPPLADFSAYCKINTFDYKAMSSSYRYEPKPCVENFKWVKSHRYWVGDWGPGEDNT